RTVLVADLGGARDAVERHRPEGAANGRPTLDPRGAHPSVRVLHGEGPRDTFHAPPAEAGLDEGVPGHVADRDFAIGPDHPNSLLEVGGLDSSERTLDGRRPPHARNA